jgi:hypothetical protein
MSDADALNEQFWRQHAACDRQLHKQRHNLAPELAGRILENRLGLSSALRTYGEETDSVPVAVMIPGTRPLLLFY